MPDSIFDLKTTLFTSNLPTAPPRDRGSDRVPGFDDLLQSAHRQSHDDQSANTSQQPAPVTNDKPRVTEHADEAYGDEQDEVTLSAQDSPTATTIPETPVIVKMVAESQPEEAAQAKEPTAEEIAVAVSAPQESQKPILIPLPEAQGQGPHQPQELAFDKTVKRASKGPAKIVVKNAQPAEQAATKQQAETTALTATPSQEQISDKNQVVVATELHLNVVATLNKPDHETAEHRKSTGRTSPQRTGDEDEPSVEIATAGTFTVTVTPEPDAVVPASKRRLETTRQSMPESSAAEPTLVAQVVRNAAMNASASPVTDAILEAAKTTTYPENSAIPTNSAEAPTPPNTPRGPQVPNSFAGRLDAATAERKANDQLSGVDRTRFVQRVARAFHRASETEGEIRLRLSPPELGALKLEVTLRDGALSARMETETAAARNLLMENLPQLRERLAEQNVRIETFEIEVRDQSRRDNAEDAQEQLRQQQEQQRNRPRGERATTPVVAAPIVRTLLAARQSAQLNVVI